MIHFNVRKQWWLVISLIVAVSIALLVIAEQWQPEQHLVGFLLAMTLVGGGFCWLYLLDRDHFWWAIIPGLSAFTLLAAALSDRFIGTDPSNDWSAVLIVGIGTSLISSILKRPDAKRVLILVSMFSLLVGFLMTPIDLALRIVLVAADILLAISVLRGIHS